MSDMSNMNNMCSNNINNNRSSCQDTCRDFNEYNDKPIGMAYVPWQTWGNVYDLNKGLHAGTIFPCLDKPFMGRCMCK